MKRKEAQSLLILIILLMVACSGGNSGASFSEATRLAIGVQQTQNAYIEQTLFAATQQYLVPPVMDSTVVETQPLESQEIILSTATQQPVQPTDAPVLQDFPSPEISEIDHFAKITNYVRADEAIYYEMDPVRQSWTDKNNYWAHLSGEEAGNFVLSAVISWEAPQDMSELARYGCGFIYGKSDPKHYHVTVVSPDQKVHTFRKRGSEEIEMKGGDVPGGGLGKYTGNAEMILVVENRVMTTYINGMQVVSFNDPYIDFGQMGLAINTGSYSGFTCSFEDVELWILK
jgi:hypothetical protein